MYYVIIHRSSYNLKKLCFRKRDSLLKLKSVIKTCIGKRCNNSFLINLILFNEKYLYYS